MTIELKINDRLGVYERLTSCAIRNLRVNSEELARRLLCGLATTEILDPYSQVIRYLDAVKIIEPKINQLVESLIVDNQINIDSELIITIPAVGFSNQEQMDLTKTLEELSKDKLVKDKKAKIIVLVNRPEGKSKDSTAEVAREVADKLDIDCIVLEAEIPLQMGNTAGSFSDEMALDPNEAPIGLLRDILNIVAMKFWIRSSSINEPILLQMDADFVGFKEGDLTTIVNYFEIYSNLQFLQCTSDWENPTKPLKEMDISLWLGAELMRELPQLIKRYLRQQVVSEEKLQQLVFGEVIQRGIQVPQVERMESIAKKGGFGLNRLKEDELDSNIRMAALSSGLKGVGSTDRVIFNWSSRRAERTWYDFRKPPISQWSTPFLANDGVRNSTDIAQKTQYVDLLTTTSLTLERLPFPKSIFTLDPSFKNTFLEILARYIPEITDQNIEIENNDNGTFLFKIK